MLQEFFALRITILTILNFHVALIVAFKSPKQRRWKIAEVTGHKFLENDLICQGESDLIRTSVDEIFVSACWRRAV